VVGVVDDALKKFVNREREDVIFTGYISDKETYGSVYRCSDFFVFPSRDEGFPLVVVDAMSYGLPIITTRRDGMLDQVDDGKNGFLVPERNAKELALRMEVITKLDYKKMGEMSREKAEKEFTWQSVTEKVINVFEEVLNEKR